MKYILWLLATATLAVACKKDTPPEYNNNVKAPLSIEFDNIAGTANLQLNTGIYSNAAGEQFTVSKLKYYISNISLISTNGEAYTVPHDSSYFLIEEGVKDRVMIQVPEGEYAALRFTLGVDSLRNTMDVSRRAGVLDPAGDAADMYWGWNSGYIFFKLEGNSPASTAAANKFQYHVGGFGGYSTATTNNLRSFTIDLSERGNAKPRAGRIANIHLMADILKVLNGSTNMSFATVSMIHSPLGAVPLANNYKQMFQHDHTEN